MLNKGFARVLITPVAPTTSAHASVTMPSRLCRSSHFVLGARSLRTVPNASLRMNGAYILVLLDGQVGGCERDRQAIHRIERIDRQRRAAAVPSCVERGVVIGAEQNRMRERAGEELHFRLVVGLYGPHVLRRVEREAVEQPEVVLQAGREDERDFRVDIHVSEVLTNRQRIIEPMLEYVSKGVLLADELIDIWLTAVEVRRNLPVRIEQGGAARRQLVEEARPRAHSES